METPENNASTVSATLLATWLNVSNRQAHRLIKKFRAVYPGDDLSRAEADHLTRARTHAARASISLEAAFEQTEAAIRVPAIEDPALPVLPPELADALNPELLLKLETYLESHGKYYGAWEVRLQRLEEETRGVRDELEAVRAQLRGLANGVQSQQTKIQNQVAANLRRNGKKGVRA